jgi:hypothetical protein
MELNFDKEIDAILRKTQSAPSATAGGILPHLDADEISAFAENSLPENSKMRCTAHLADCERCRKLLSNLILLNAEPASEIVHAEQTAPAIPWYRKFLVFPNLAYSLGALALVFGSLIVFTLIQSVDKNSYVSQVSNTFNKSNAAAPANANVQIAAANTPASSVPANMPAANSGVVTKANEPAGAPIILPKSASRTEKDEGYCQDCGSPSDEENKPGNKDLAKEQPAAVDDKASGAGKVTEDAKRADRNKTTTDITSVKNERQAPSVSALGDIAATKQAKKKVNEKSDSAQGETTRISGKTFRREGGAWVDSEFQRGSNMILPPLTYVSRGSGEYKKLDGDLKRIAEKLNGVVIVMWKGKAYRIQ